MYNDEELRYGYSDPNEYGGGGDPIEDESMPPGADWDRTTSNKGYAPQAGVLNYEGSGATLPGADWSTAPFVGDSTNSSTLTATPFNREQFRDEINGAPDAYSVLSKYGLKADKAGRVALPTGETMDVIYGASAGGTRGQWTGVEGGGQKTGQAAGYGGSSTGSTSGKAAGGSSGSGYQDAVRAALMAQLTQMGKPIDPNDPVISTQMNAQSNLLERQRQQRRSAMAERMAASGLNSGGAGSGAMDQEIAAGFEDKASQLSGLQGQLMARANEQRVSQLQQALSLAVQSGDAESARAIQMEIARMSNALGQAQLGQQAAQWNDNYGLQSAALQYQRDRDAARARLGLDF